MGEKGRDRRGVRERKRERGRESQAGSTPCAEPKLGLDPMILGSNLSQNHESDAQPIEPPRHPKILFPFFLNVHLFFRQRVQAGRGKEREIEDQKQALC